MAMVKGSRFGIVLGNTIILILLFLFLVPLLQTVFTSIKDNKEIYRIPATLVPLSTTAAHYQRVFTGLKTDFFSFFKNSVVVTIVSVSLTLFLGSLAAYGLARIDFFGKKFIIFFISFVVSIPLIITVIPIFMDVTDLSVVLPVISCEN